MRLFHTASPTESLRTITHWWKDHFVRPDAFGAQGERDQAVLREVAADIGLSPDELIEITRRGPRAADELAAVFKELNVDAQIERDNNALLLNDMKRVCVLCKSKRICRKSVSDKIIDANLEEICPNATTIREMQVSHIGNHSHKVTLSLI